MIEKSQVIGYSIDGPVWWTGYGWSSDQREAITVSPGHAAKIINWQIEQNKQRGADESIGHLRTTVQRHYSFREKVRRFFKDAWEDANFTYGYDVMEEQSGQLPIDWVEGPDGEVTAVRYSPTRPTRPTLLGMFISTIFDRVRFHFRMRYCDKHGHDFEMTGHGGPESGYEAGECKRCGFSFHHRMY